MNVLVTGASGYIGKNLIPELLRAGHNVRGMSRNPEWLELPEGATGVAGDVLDRQSLKRALEGIDAAYYLVHSMETQTGDSRSFAERDRIAAQNFAAAADAAGVKRIIYLGGLGNVKDGLSHHLASRIEVGEILQSGSVPTTVFRAAIIVGAWGSSFQMIQGLVEKLPLMITPRWVETQCQPIALRDVLYYLVECLNNEQTTGRTFDIGGPDILSYRQMMLQFGEVLEKKIAIIGVPVLTPRLSSYWVNLVTPIPASLARPLIDGLRHRVVREDTSIDDIMPHACRGYKDSIRAALDRQGWGRIRRVKSCYRLEWRQWIERTPEEITDFFGTPDNLIPMTPEKMHFQLSGAYPRHLTAGSEMSYKLRVFGFPVRWRSRITEWEPGERFQDEQVSGPYKLWRHTHTFEERDGGTIVYDSVDYNLPFWWAGRIAHFFAVRFELKRIFKFRSRMFARLLAQ